MNLKVGVGLIFALAACDSHERIDLVSYGDTAEIRQTFESEIARTDLIYVVYINANENIFELNELNFSNSELVPDTCRSTIMSKMKNSDIIEVQGPSTSPSGPIKVKYIALYSEGSLLHACGEQQEFTIARF